jgi:pullulanase
MTDNDAGAAGRDLRRARAHWLSEDFLAWDVPVAAGDSVALHCDPGGDLTLTAGGVAGGEAIPLVHEPAGLLPETLARFPHLGGSAAFKLPPAQRGRARQLLRGRLAVSATGAGGEVKAATGVQVAGVLDDLFAWRGALGVAWEGGVPVLRLWAPTARAVSLLLFDDPAPATAARRLPMRPDSATGVWSLAGEADWDRKFYLYEVEVLAPATGRVETDRVTDPYSASLAADSRRSQIVDLGDPGLAPPGWAALVKPACRMPEDVVVYELHVRDFSIADRSVPALDRGTFRAFTHRGAAGMRHLAALARAGVSHLQLLPCADFTSVPERRSDQRLPAGDLAALPPDSAEQQERIGRVRHRDGYNWGYDPWHFAVPEGSYATDPDGPARILELRQMVAALDGIGLRVVVDVVFNHTAAAGQDPHAILDRIVPGYYHRRDADGAVERFSSGADTASEHAMMEKLIVDSALTWARTYKVDGFRFDLMGLHGRRTLERVRAALDDLTPAADGVHGRAIALWGEGWQVGGSAAAARGPRASQRHLAGTGIATFSDRLRDGVRGGNPFSDPRRQGFATGLGYDPNGPPQGDEGAALLHLADWVRVGLAGDLAGYRLEDAAGRRVRADGIDYFGQPAGYTAAPGEALHYVAAHDNETLFDSIQLKAPRATPMAERVRIHNLATSLVALAQGIPFFHAGQDLLRSKSGDRDSYDSGDWFNAIDWTLATSGWGRGLPPAEKNRDRWPLLGPLLADPALAPSPADRARAAEHFREVLAIRRSTGLFRLASAAEVEARLAFHNTGPEQIPGLIVMSLADDGGEVDPRWRRVVALFNARTEGVLFAAPELAGFDFRLHPLQAASGDPVVRQAAYDRETGAFAVPARTTAVFVAERPAQRSRRGG